MIYRLMIQIGTKTALHCTLLHFTALYCTSLYMRLAQYEIELACLPRLFSFAASCGCGCGCGCEVCLCLTLSKLYDYIVYVADNTRIIVKFVTSVCLVSIAIVRIHVM